MDIFDVPRTEHDAYIKPYISGVTITRILNQANFEANEPHN